METEKKLESLVEKQRAYFAEGKTLPIEGRIRALNRLEQALKNREEELCRALKADLGKSRIESYMCEVGLTLSELGYVKRHLRSWSRDKRVRTPLAQFHARSFTVQEPYGVVLVMSPWNYPVLLTLEPLIGALAAGNCCVVKPSAYSPETSAVMASILREIFPEEYVAVVEGGRQENQGLLAQRFDYIFFTGGVNVGKLVMEKASAHLTPVTLELGGKSPCVIDESANLKLAARRLAFGKYLNCGQTCVAPDYVLVHEKVKERFLEYVKEEITHMYGRKPLENPDYGKIINRKHFDRLLGLIDESKLVFGGESSEETLQIAPSVLDRVTPEDAVMQEEIFGPLLPILTVRSMDEALAFVNARPKPLAFYIFTQNKSVEQMFLRRASFGGGCVNDTIIHLATSAMGFGGVGNSGMGSYHGKKSFETFSHEKSIVKKYTWLDLPMRYQPYTKQKDKMIRTFLK
ncbi:aldehyde dehydrogenase family protein [Lachnoclostridium sp. An131]|jgi:aldehyde dehydrogenase (NAD+)|uniref:aldehyde dehydrogenase n=1 Tax=Lachnoclostridium sp. An131 TaxID=1965555 RepID=UPI000B381103|nr:aldehyde dehydrogenase [Lachnoclostridium sp. An131]OUQ25364.1 aldehyde dehydrogenase family protein [Lachnoclostridium sp. An131]